MTTRTDPIRVFIADDHPMIRVGLRAMIEAEGALALAGEAGDGEEALAGVLACRPDVVLMDLVMPRLDGISAIARLRPLLPETRFVVLTSLLDPAEVRRAIDAGASGYLMKNASSPELVNVILAVHAGRRVLDAEATDALIGAQQQPSPGADLTQRERELLALMTEGLNNQEIGERLAIAVPTVKFHITNILAKLQVDNRTEAVILALKHRLVPGR
ncbi:MAG TPA: response regulator transcription factor [Burkholderiaceae bacterium]|nr:response regulator transcription factor [Burkholderiaceae bacterium]HNB43735.1 response regulator transcription factor [Burkholderiaceae bacterium]HNG80470.1 response regulator transcription factor [Burkholderiaceae bacterium]